MAELNAFYLKTLLWIPSDHPLVTLRLVACFLFALPATREAYQYLADPRCRRIGVHAWMAVINVATEVLVCVKFGRGEFPEPTPIVVIVGWAPWPRPWSSMPW